MVQVFTPIIGEERAIAFSVAVTVENAETIPIGVAAEKDKRGLFHKEVKTLIGNRYISTADNGQIIVSRATAQAKREQDRRSNAGKPIKYLHFTLYKENTDNSTALRFIANQCGFSSRQLLFSGTKDKRAVTLQRIACRGLEINRLDRVNRMSVSRNGIVRVGDYVECDDGLSLGDLAGNHFTIALRVVDQASADALRNGSYPLGLIEKTLATNGFVNYFGPQRFGTTSVLTSDVGRLMLKGQFKEAITAILESRCEISPEAQPMLTAFTTLPSPQCFTEALHETPAYCYAERDLLKYLAQNPNNFRNAFSSMMRTSVMMYFHAVQSWFWNEWVSRRLALKPLEAIVGDMVAVGSICDEIEEKGNEPAEKDVEEIKQETSSPSNESAHLPEIHFVTEDDVAKKKYTIFDVVMTVPGCDPKLEYPKIGGALTKESLMAEINNQGLQSLFDPMCDMAKQYHFFGTYRKIVQSLKDFKLNVKTYESPLEVLIETDLSKIKKRDTGVTASNVMAAAPSTAAQQGVAVIAEFSLPAGAYATCVLREFTETVRGNF
eukprot:GILI01017959.1.p1 GENE.GILI01017959.1~~GILI01017959.1.p1  ORF type:complete len:582 (+),score=105.72 GILI01017959.1:98-1747(+)